MIRHRGRTVRCTAPAEITCDKCGCVICVKRLPRKKSAKEN
nr:MAG TPA: HTH-type transcriptional regulator [Bacteriophage sp.]